MRELSLFSGAGGGLLGTKLLGWEHIGYVENNEYCQKVLKQRIKDGILDDAPIFGDIRSFLNEGYADSYQGMVDVVTAGFPCQPYSTASAGKQPACTMLSYTIECIRTVLPRFVFCENVSRRAIGNAARELQKLSYHTRPAKVSASDLGADHIRERYWLLAYTDNESKLLRQDNAEVAKLPGICASVWKTFPGYTRMDDGLPDRVDRLKATGNGQVPSVVRAAWELLNDQR